MDGGAGKKQRQATFQWKIQLAAVGIAAWMIPQVV